MMQHLKLAFFHGFLFACLAALPALGQDDSPLTRLFDTGGPSPLPLAGPALDRPAGWRPIPEDTVNHAFGGDAVFLNDKLAVVLRQQGRGPEVYARGAAGFKLRATLAHWRAGAAAGDALAGLKIAENGSGAVTVEAAFQGAGSPALGLRLTTGEGILEIRPSAGAGAVGVESLTRHVVVPDFFGDDLVFGADAFTGRALPAENLCLSLLDGGDAIMMGVWQSSRQDVWLAASGPGAPALRIGCLAGKSIWLAFIEGAGLWRAEAAPGKFQPPFAAKWRCDYLRAGGVADSWDAERGPAPEQLAGPHAGLAIVYPLDRNSTTPLTAVLPTDVMRNTLGVGPCQYILAVEGMAAEGDPTPDNVMNWVEKQFEQRKEKKAAGDIRERLDQMVAHAAQARARIKGYGDFAARARALLAGAPGAAPWLAIVEDLSRFADAGLAPAAAPERAGQLAAGVIALKGQENAAAACRGLGGQLRDIGAIQDRALARCRMAVRRLRQEGRSLAGVPEKNAGAAAQVQSLAGRMLFSNTPGEGSAK